MVDKNQTSTTNSEHKPIIGFTIGDPNGIGPEILLKLLADHQMTRFCTPIIYGSTKLFGKYRRLLNIEEQQLFHLTKDAAQIHYKKTNLLQVWDEEFPIEPGKATDIAGKYAFISLKRATEDLQKGFIDALVTCPINKKNIQQEGFQFVGHTEYFADFFKAQNVLMFMVSENLKVALATEHIPLGAVKEQLSKERIEKKLDALITSLQKDFAIARPKIAVLGINPHAGDQGAIGSEENTLLEPILKAYREKGKFVNGPFSTDGFFAAGTYQHYDAVFAMYHDQGLTPFKMLAFEEGVNFTAGLPVVRTSPDHGTAYDIAGKNIASESSLRNATFMAIDILKWRKQAAQKQAFVPTLVISDESTEV